EVQRDALDPVLARPGNRLADQPLVEAVRRRAQPRHRGERQRGRRPAEREVEEAVWPSVLVAADDEERLVVTEPEERVEGHHEAALRRLAAPRACDFLEFR